MPEELPDKVGEAPRRPRSRRGEGDRLRTEIVNAAARMLAKTGDVGDVSLRSVAREVGVAATSIYLHFGNLDELVLAVKIQYLAEFGATLDEAADTAGDVPLARARARGRQYVKYGLANPGSYWVMFSSEMLPKSLMPDGTYLGRGVFEAARGDIAQAAGPDADADMLAVHFWTALHGIVTLRTSRSMFPWPDLDRQVDDLIDRLLEPS
jgi:AcrR family transcriptional regulator